MSHNFSLKTYEGRTIIILLFIIFGFTSSKALISIGTGALLVNLVLSFKEHKLLFVKMSALPILAASTFLILHIGFLLCAPSLPDAFNQIWIRLPWLIIPISIAAIKNITKQMILFLIGFLIFTITVSGIIVIINYFSNFEYFTQQISMGKPIPTPLNHIRFSLMVAFTGVTSIFFTIKNQTRFTSFDKYIFLFTSIFQFALLHILAVRSGLLSYYIALFFLFIYFSVNLKKWWLLPLVIVFISATPYLAYQNIESFKNKVDYMVYDLNELKNGNVGHNSDARRIRAVQIASELIKEKPILGYGIGSVNKTMQNYYATYMPEVSLENQKIPHNQFVFTLLELGIIGLLILVLVLLVPLSVTLWFKNPLFICLWIIIVSSCMVENTFESQLGLSFYLIFASLLLKLSPHE